ncbi:Sulfotransferase family protein [Jannaschia faecimaris]|uniref:Sulfotransferase family protein n=1 Tax=Jannaschia faecimaris TaxID=1244108 RepID=A0A1H3TVU5_9RHOB|nr:sulfotransferase family 2 domain-containing protein [Jannaschia faecimaris]SDZ54197.1 Sulfotransferase family protein [Jannaschia faecimaris]
MPTPPPASDRPSTTARLRTLRREWLDARGLSAIGRRIYSSRVAFVHVPKCAGRSVERGLRRAHRWSRGHVHAGATFDQAAGLLGRPIADQDDRQTVLEAASDRRAAVYAYHLALGLGCVTGHAPVNAALVRLHAERHAFVTVLRDPVERFVSHFRYSYMAEGQGRIDLNLEAFLRTRRAVTFGSMYAKYFAHGVPPERTAGAVRDCLEQFAAIGFIDDMSRFERDVAAALGRRVSFGHINKTATRRSSAPSEGIDPDLRAEIVRLCAPDREIYAWARARADRDG